MSLKTKLKETFFQIVNDFDINITKNLRSEIITNIYHLFQNSCSDPDVDIKQELIDLFNDLMIENDIDIIEYKDFIETIITEYVCLFEDYCNEDEEESEKEDY